MKDYGIDFRVSHILTDPERQWTQFRNASSGKIRTAFRELDVDWKKYNTKDYLFTHDTACCSVATEQNGYWLTPPCWELVNANGNAWTTPVLLASFKTFIGGDNFLEHMQIPALSKGKILDAIARPVVHHSEKYGDANIYYVDVLVATDRKHTSLVERIESGKLNTLSMGCGKADCQVTMSDGTFKDIVDIEVGDEVLTHKNRARKVTRLFKADVDDVPCYKIYANSLWKPIELTGEHPVYIVKAEDIRCKNGRPCKIGFEQAQCKNFKSCKRDKSEYEYPMSFVPISELKKGDYLACAYDTEVIDNPELTNEWCKLFGLYMGDGGLNWNWLKNEQGENIKKSPYSVVFTININERNIYDEICDIVNKLMPGTRVSYREHFEISGLSITVHSKKLAEQFFNYGNCGSHEKKFDDAIMKLPNEKQMQIISGMIDTDGCYYEKKGEISWSTVSYDMWNQFHLMLLRNHIPNLQTAVYRKPGKNGALYEKGTYSWQYMIEISKSNNGVIPSFKNKNYGNSQVNINEVSFFYKDYYLCPIKKIEKESYTGMVYNFSVDEDESYLVNNMIVHNCLAEITQCSICGKKIYDGDKNCEHLDRYIGQMVTCSDGKDRICAELCGACDEHGDYIEGSNVFIELSWVEHPAFRGAVVNSFVETEQEKELRENSRNDLEKLFSENLFERLRVADADTRIALKITKDLTRDDRIAGKIIKDI